MQTEAKPFTYRVQTESDEGTLATLSKREEQVLGLAAAGLLDKQISLELGVSLNTLRTYWRRIRTKVGEATRSGLTAAYATQFSYADETQPDWELDLATNTWRKLSDQMASSRFHAGAEMSLEEALAEFHPDDQPGLRVSLQELSPASPSEFTFSARTIMPSGEIVRAVAFVRVVRDDSGVPVKLLGRQVPVLDIESGGPAFRASVPQDGWTYDWESKQILASDHLNAIHGLTPGVRHPRELYAGKFFAEDFARAATVIDAVATGRHDTAIVNMRTVESNGLEEVLMTIHGIKDRKGVVQHVIGYRSGVRSTAAVGTSGVSFRVGFWAMDLRKHAFILPDEEFCRIYRVNRDSATLDDDIRSRYIPKDADAAYDFIDQAVSEGRERGAQEFRLAFEDGSTQRIRLDYYIEHDDRGPIRINGTVRTLN